MPAVTLDKTYKFIATGLVKTTAAAVQMATIDCRMAQIKSAAGNTQTHYIGGPGVTAPSGTADTTTGWPLAAGEETGWIPVENLNQLYIIGGTAGESLYYMLVE